MPRFSLLVLVTLTGAMLKGAAAPALAQQASGPRPVGTMHELMVEIVYPTSEAVFQVALEAPSDESGWQTLQGQALMLAETANLLMMPGHTRAEDQWIEDATRLLEAGEAAFAASKRQDVAALELLNDQLYESCTICHDHYRVDSGQR